MNTCHDYQARGSGRQPLHLLCASIDFHFLASHYDLFLGFGIILLVFSTTLDNANYFLAFLLLESIVAEFYRPTQFFSGFDVLPSCSAWLH
jgi:hypothetical protein